MGPVSGARGRGQSWLCLYFICNIKIEAAPVVRTFGGPRACVAAGGPKSTEIVLRGVKGAPHDLCEGSRRVCPLLQRRKGISTDMRRLEHGSVN